MAGQPLGIRRQYTGPRRQEFREQPIGGRARGAGVRLGEQELAIEREWRQELALERALERELEPIKAKVHLLEKMESPGTSESEMRRFLRKLRFENESQIIMMRGPDSLVTTGPRKLNDKLTEFLTNVYLGDLYGNPLYDEERVGRPIQEYLYFLNPEDPLYQITSINILSHLIYIYMRVNTIKFYDVIHDPNITSGDNRRIVLRGDGTEDLSEFKQYSQEEYDEAPTYQLPGVGEVKTAMTIVIAIFRTNMIPIGRDISVEDFTDFSERSVRLDDSLEYSLSTLHNPLIKSPKESNYI